MAFARHGIVWQPLKVWALPFVTIEVAAAWCGPSVAWLGQVGHPSSRRDLLWRPLPSHTRDLGSTA